MMMALIQKNMSRLKSRKKNRGANVIWNWSDRDSFVGRWTIVLMCAFSNKGIERPRYEQTRLDS